MSPPSPARAPRVLLAPLAALALAGCISSAATVVKAPFAVGGKAIDLATTSPAEADRNYARRMRKQEEREGRERREWARRCRKTPDDPECRHYEGYRARG